ncbi:hypothetical protein ACUHMQ_20780, partial [Chitinimonas sp. PSY-7]|uniref:hypothetical protein n=1 Tax=Chitinimonas sp. PSY-7 TaxID=3459088 RepID=UPI00403FD0D7
GLCRQGLEDGHEPIRYSLRGSVYSIIRVNLKPALNTEILTPPPTLLSAFCLFIRSPNLSDKPPSFHYHSLH